ncbi:hypothetical protein ABZP36_016325 [Zizania latifolia]
MLSSKVWSMLGSPSSPASPRALSSAAAAALLPGPGMPALERLPVPPSGGDVLLGAGLAETGCRAAGALRPLPYSSSPGDLE